MAAALCRVTSFLRFPLRKGVFQLVTIREEKSLAKGKEATPAKPEVSDGDAKIVTSAAVTADGIYKRHGELTSFFRTLDGKRVYPGKDKKLRVAHLTKIRVGMSLCMQKRLYFHPGLNVGLGRDLTLYSLENGTVYITYEKVNPNWDHYVVRDYYHDQKDMNIYMPHYNVVPTPQSQTFKLVEQL